MNIKSLLIMPLIAGILILTACDQQSNDTNITVSGDTLSAPLPRALLTVDATTLVVELVIDNNSPQTCTNLTVDQINGTYSCSISLPLGQHFIALNFLLNDPTFGMVPVATASSINVDIVSGHTATADFSLSPLTYRDDDNDGANNISEILIGTNPLENGDTHGVDPLTPLTSSPSTITISVSALGIPDIGTIDLTVTNGFDGDIVFDLTTALNADGGRNFFLTTPSINVTNIERTSALDLSCTDGTIIKITESANFVSGRVETAGVVNGETRSCTSNFATVLPSIIFNDSDNIANLLDEWGSDDDTINAAQTGLSSTTCPQNDAFDNFNPFISGCSGSILENYSVTDDLSTTHNLSQKITFSTTPSNSSNGLGSIDITGPGDILFPDTFFLATGFTERNNALDFDSLDLLWGDINDTVVTVFLNPDQTLTGVVFVDNSEIGAFFTALDATDGLNTIVSSDSIEFLNLIIENDNGSGDFIILNGLLFRP